MHIIRVVWGQIVSSNRVMASKTVKKLSEDNTDFTGFVEDTIEMLLKSERTFIITSKEGIPPVLFRKDADGIWVALLSELQGI